MEYHWKKGTLAAGLEVLQSVLLTVHLLYEWRCSLTSQPSTPPAMSALTLPCLLCHNEPIPSGTLIQNKTVLPYVSLVNIFLSQQKDKKPRQEGVFCLHPCGRMKARPEAAGHNASSLRKLRSEGWCFLKGQNDVTSIQSEMSHPN